MVGQNDQQGHQICRPVFVSVQAIFEYYHICQVKNIDQSKVSTSVKKDGCMKTENYAYMDSKVVILTLFDNMIPKIGEIVLVIQTQG